MIMGGSDLSSWRSFKGRSRSSLSSETPRRSIEGKLQNLCTFWDLHTHFVGGGLLIYLTGMKQQLVLQLLPNCFMA